MYPLAATIHIHTSDSFVNICINKLIWTRRLRTDGDTVTIDAELNLIHMDVSDEEIAARLKKWKAPRLKVNRGTLAKYVHLVGDASHGVSLLPVVSSTYNHPA